MMTDLETGPCHADVDAVERDRLRPRRGVRGLSRARPLYPRGCAAALKFHLLAMFALALSLFQAAAPAAPTPVGLDRNQAQGIGLHASYLRETGGRLPLAAVTSARVEGRFTPAGNPIMNFGIGSPPVWLHFNALNATGRALPRRLAVETAWLDRVEVYFRRDGRTVAYHVAGDEHPFASRPIASRHFVFEHAFSPGATDVFIRVQTPDPMLVPLYLLSPSQAQARQSMQDYSYGFLYGFLIALLGYNLMLYAGLREPRYIFYSLYLGMFLLMNMAYTGHGMRWLWPDSPVWAQWSNPVLMVLYGVSGLLFATRFLDTRHNFPRVHRAVLAYAGAGVGLLALAVVFNRQHYALLVAFSFVTLFTLIMLALGVLGVRAGQRAARYFLLAAVSAMVGAATTALAVWGVIPTSVWTYRAVDIGMLLDATLLALALTYQFRIGQDQRLRAEQLARMDPLTGMNNRRAFTDKAVPIWNIALRRGHTLSVVLLDIDCFKRINDMYGHAYGDEVLMAVAGALDATIRSQDVAARWGGEEFILLLPETALEEATVLAERLRLAIECIRITHPDDIITVTASFGVAQRGPEHSSLDALISTADKYLYQSKSAGRNRISCAPGRCLEAVALP